jgi:hypothetical protein
MAAYRLFSIFALGLQREVVRCVLNLVLAERVDSSLMTIERLPYGSDLLDA